MSDKTDAERAMEWLDGQIGYGVARETVTITETLAHLRTIKTMLAAPRVPDVNDHAEIDRWLRQFEESRWTVTRDGFVRLLTALHEPPKPRTKTVAIEQWAVVNAKGGAALTHETAAAALEGAKHFNVHGRWPPYTVVKLTGTAEIPE
ncbi:MAG: hypothetical protein ACLGSH_01780 [Acidobacteriota bacterium]